MDHVMQDRAQLLRFDSARCNTSGVVH